MSQATASMRAAGRGPIRETIGRFNGGALSGRQQAGPLSATAVGFRIHRPVRQMSQAAASMRAAGRDLIRETIGRFNGGALPGCQQDGPLRTA